MAVCKPWFLFIFCWHFQAILPGSNSSRLLRFLFPTALAPIL